MMDHIHSRSPRWTHPLQVSVQLTERCMSVFPSHSVSVCLSLALSISLSLSHCLSLSLSVSLCVCLSDSGIWWGPPQLDSATAGECLTSSVSLVFLSHSFLSFCLSAFCHLQFFSTSLCHGLKVTVPWITVLYVFHFCLSAFCHSQFFSVSLCLNVTVPWITVLCVLFLQKVRRLFSAFECWSSTFQSLCHHSSFNHAVFSRW